MHVLEELRKVHVAMSGFDLQLCRSEIEASVGLAMRVQAEIRRMIQNSHRRSGL